MWFCYSSLCTIFFIFFFTLFFACFILFDFVFSSASNYFIVTSKTTTKNYSCAKNNTAFCDLDSGKNQRKKKTKTIFACWYFPFSYGEFNLFPLSLSHSFSSFTRFIFLSTLCHAFCWFLFVVFILFDTLWMKLKHILTAISLKGSATHYTRATRWEKAATK